MIKFLLMSIHCDSTVNAKEESENSCGCNHGGDISKKASCNSDHSGDLCGCKNGENNHGCGSNKDKGIISDSCGCNHDK